ncbi:MAG: subfamily polymerase sigma factor [Candidatus Nomurabacteria bacterium]|jgi:RNA polymerase sigma-70 factor (ECF subfamily)|nr:subfamily polymerase sigma factor [Candidatus Nomurabacteria bacterium]
MSEEPTDIELIHATLQDNESYRHVIARYRPKLLRYIGRLGVRDGQQQEDILQEVFIKVYRHLNAYNEAFPFSSWIYRITHNETMSYFRRKRLQPLSLDVLLHADLIFPAAEIPAEETFDPERITMVLNQLDQKYKDVIVLKYFEDKSYDEMADILQKPPGTIATLINRAKQKLKVLLETKNI